VVHKNDGPKKVEISATMDSHKRWDTSTTDIPGVFINADMVRNVLAKLIGPSPIPAANNLLTVNPDAIPNLRPNNGFSRVCEQGLNVQTASCFLRTRVKGLDEDDVQQLPQAIFACNMGDKG